MELRPLRHVDYSVVARDRRMRVGFRVCVSRADVTGAERAYVKCAAAESEYILGSTACALGVLHAVRQRHRASPSAGGGREVLGVCGARVSVVGSAGGVRARGGGGGARQTRARLHSRAPRHVARHFARHAARHVARTLTHPCLMPLLLGVGTISLSCKKLVCQR